MAVASPVLQPDLRDPLAGEERSELLRMENPGGHLAAPFPLQPGVVKVAGLVPGQAVAIDAGSSQQDRNEQKRRGQKQIEAPLANPRHCLSNPQHTEGPHSAREVAIQRDAAMPCGARAFRIGFGASPLS